MLKQIVILLSLLLSACGASSNDVFQNVNLDEQHVQWAQEAMDDLVDQTGGKCWVTISDEGDNKLQMVDSLPNWYWGQTKWVQSRYDKTLYEPSTVLILDLADMYVDGELEDVRINTLEREFKVVLQHELIHHCSKRIDHLKSGNIMSRTVADYPLDNRLTKADLAYISK